jgi:CheY-like chemotaxis protein
MGNHSERILVAEDDPVVRLLLVETLEEGGFDVLAAEDGTAALMLMDNPDHVDVLVTDINMGLFDGIDVAEQARRDHPAVKVLFISAYPEPLAAERVTGPYRFLAKPFTMADLRGIVDEMVKH